MYLKRDSIYYCEDASNLLSTFHYLHGPRGIDEKGEAAVERYLLESGKCEWLRGYLEEALATRLRYDYGRWKDSVKDSTVTPYDSTLPSLKDIGFEALLGPDAYVPLAQLPKSILGQIRVVPSITADHATLEAEMNFPATLSAELFDALGNRVQWLTDDRFLQRGPQRIGIAASLLGAGTYYVRVTVPEGEVKTVRFVKQ